MKVEIQQGGQRPSEIKYPCVMVREGSGIAIAETKNTGIWIDHNGEIATHTRGGTWIFSGRKPATGPVTITLTNE